MMVYNTNIKNELKKKGDIIMKALSKSFFEEIRLNTSKKRKSAEKYVPFKWPKEVLKGTKKTNVSLANKKVI
ncbi:MAG TPA: hypothetical protein PLC53_01770 [Bacilli bacterium]|nr:hypothetical protein [Bacilli bacterium]